MNLNEVWLLVVHRISLRSQTICVCRGGGLDGKNGEEGKKEQQKFPFFISPSASICKYEGWGLDGGGTLPQWWRPFFSEQSANPTFDTGDSDSFFLYLSGACSHLGSYKNHIFNSIQDPRLADLSC